MIGFGSTQETQSGASNFYGYGHHYYWYYPVYYLYTYVSHYKFW